MLSVFLQWPSVLQPFIGYLADRTNLRYLVILAPAITGIAMSLLGVAPSYAWLGILLLIAGLSSAAMHSVGSVIAGGLSGSQLGRGMGYWMVGGGLGYTIGPLILVTTIQTAGIQAMPWLMLGGLVTSAVLYVRLRDVTSCTPDYDASRPWRQAVRAMRPVLIPALGITMVRSFMSAAFGTYLPTYLSWEGSTLWIAGAAFALFEGAGMVGALTAGAFERSPGAAAGHHDLLAGRFAVDGRVPGVQRPRPHPDPVGAGVHRVVAHAGAHGDDARAIPGKPGAGERDFPGV